MRDTKRNKVLAFLREHHGATAEELAAAGICSSKNAVSTLLSTLRGEGLVGKSGDKFVALDPSAAPATPAANGNGSPPDSKREPTKAAATPTDTSDPIALALAALNTQRDNLVSQKKTIDEALEKNEIARKALSA